MNRSEQIEAMTLAIPGDRVEVAGGDTWMKVSVTGFDHIENHWICLQFGIMTHASNLADDEDGMEFLDG